MFATQYLERKSIINGNVAAKICLLSIATGIGLYIVVNEYGSKDPNSYWVRNKALILQEVDFKGPFIDYDFNESIARDIHLERKLYINNNPNRKVNWVEMGRDVKWKDIERFPTKKGHLLAVGLYRRDEIRIIPYELRFKDENASDITVKLSTTSDGAFSLNNWIGVFEDEIFKKIMENRESEHIDTNFSYEFDFNKIQGTEYVVLLPKVLNNKLSENKDIEQYAEKIYKAYTK